MILDWSRLFQSLWVSLLVFCVIFQAGQSRIGHQNETGRAHRASLVHNLKKLKKLEGAVKLVGGRASNEGNVEILHSGQWGAICDDEWDKKEATVICRQLGYHKGAKHTHSGTYGHAKRRYWMDNVYCDGTEEEISQCRFDGWGNSDCTPEEAAGVICEVHEEEPIKVSKIREESKILFPKAKLRLVGGRVATEGRIEVRPPNENWQVICGDGWSLLEAMVVCKQLKLGYANDASQTNYFGGNTNKSRFSGVKCSGSEKSLNECVFNEVPFCPGDGTVVASVSCVKEMADLVMDHVELMQTAHLEDRQMFFLQCAMEENCLASQAYKIQQESNSWHLETRRLLRFTAKILNAGTADFRPIIPKHLWEWHMCHMHYHSMEVFATFDIYDATGVRVAEGHKASFCLEDNQCMPGVKPRFACANYGDQGISVNCTDIYKYTVDCQWVDISELDPGIYTLKVAVNPEYKIPEMSFDNNAAICTFLYQETGGRVYNCTNTKP